MQRPLGKNNLGLLKEEKEAVVAGNKWGRVVRDEVGKVCRDQIL